MVMMISFQLRGQCHLLLYESAMIHGFLFGMIVPFIPNEVTPWFTAFRAYSVFKLAACPDSERENACLSVRVCRWRIVSD